MRVRAIVVALLTLVCAVACRRADVGQEPDVPTFNRDIAPLVWDNCAPCHRPDGQAPFSLVTYADVRSHASQIVTATKNRQMPPWLPEPGYGSFEGERHLEPVEIARLERWVARGVPEGEASDRRSPPEWRRGWQLGEPDLVVGLPDAYTLAAGGGDVFRNFVIPIPLDASRYVHGMEVRPGARGVVHHATILIDRTRASRRLDAADPQPGYSGMFSESARNPESHALGWTPGRTPVLEPPGVAWRLDPSSDLVIQLHMIPSGKPETVRPSVGLFFATAPPTRTPMDFKLGSKTIDIPAGASDYTIDDRVTLPVDVDVLSVYPHAHYLAAEMKAWADLPNGEKRWLLWIKRWDFNWQDQYRFVEPVRLPKGTTVTMQYRYDNSAANVRNPHHPPQPVSWGPASSDEMGDLWLQMLPLTASDGVTLAQTYIEGELRKNIVAAEQMVAKRPSDADWLNALGARYIEAGRIPEGIEKLENAIRVAPNHAEAHHNLGTALRRTGRVPEAIAQFRRAAALDPGNDRMHYSLADALMEREQLDEAIQQFRRAIAINPDAADAHNDLGVALASKGNIDEAIVHFQRALAIRPDYPDAAKNLNLAKTVEKPQR